MLAFVTLLWKVLTKKMLYQKYKKRTSIRYRKVKYDISIIISIIKHKDYHQAKFKNAITAQEKKYCYFSTEISCPFGKTFEKNESN